eukprot:9905913-Ditylum_brightwellii.AAC.1
MRPRVSGKGSLYYVICKAMPVGWTPTSREDRLTYATPHAGLFFNTNNHLTYRIIENGKLALKHLYAYILLKTCRTKVAQ